MKAIYSKNGLYAGFVYDKLRLADAINKLGTLPLVNQPGERFTYGLSIDVLGYLSQKKYPSESLDQFFTGKNIPAFGHERYLLLPAAIKIFKVSTCLYTR